jgi:hypothetical protein
MSIAPSMSSVQADEDRGSRFRDNTNCARRMASSKACRSGSNRLERGERLTKLSAASVILWNATKTSVDGWCFIRSSATLSQHCLLNVTAETAAFPCLNVESQFSRTGFTQRGTGHGRRGIEGCS